MSLQAIQDSGTTPCGAPDRSARVERTRGIQCRLAAGARDVSFLHLARSRRHAPPARIYITDARHFLDEKGAIAPRLGPAKRMADFHAGLIAHATGFDDTGILAPTCFKCKKMEVKVAIAQDDAILWSCPHCNAEGRVSNWRGTLWDLSERPGLGS